MHRLLIILIIALIGCSPEKEGTLFIQSNGLKHGDLILEKVNVKSIETVDTLNVIDNKAFFTYQAPEIGVYRVKKDDISSAFIILDKREKVNISFGKDSVSFLSVDNGLNKEVHQLNKLLAMQDSLESLFQRDYLLAKRNHDEENAFADINRKYEMSKIQMERALKAILDSESKSFSKLLLVSWFSFFEDYEVYSKTLNSLEKDHGETAYYKELKEVFESKTKWMNKEFPKLELKDVNDNLVSLNDLKSKFILVEFWNTKCLPYIQGIHEHKRITDRYEKEDLIVLSINLDKDLDLWKNTIKNLGLKFKNVNDPVGFEMSELILRLSIGKIPANYLLNSERKIIAQNKWGRKLEDALIENISY